MTFIGCEFIKRLAKTYSLNEIAAFPLDIVYKEFAEYAT